MKLQSAHRRHLLPSLTTALAVLGVSSHCSAVTLVSNLGEPQGTATTFTSGSITGQHYLAASFTTGPNATTVTGATLRLQNVYATIPSGDATYELSLWTDSAGSPASSIGTFDTNPTLPETTVDGAQLVTFSDLGLALAPNTTYWLGLRNTTGQLLTWYSTNSTAETSAAGWSIGDGSPYESSNSGASWQQWPFQVGPSQFELEGTTNVPEPGSTGMLLAGVIGAMAMFRSRARR